MALWGGDANTANKPSWGYLTTSRIANTANLVAKASGWVLERPWGDEVIVAISNLSTNPQFRVLRVDALNGVVNAAAQNVAVRVVLSEGVAVANTPTIVAIGAGAGASNVTLSYSATDSNPKAGILVFKANTSLAAFAVGATLTVNATSATTQTGNVATIETPRTLPSGIPAGVSATLTVTAA